MAGKILINETFAIDATIKEEWVNWIEHKYIPQIVASKLITTHIFSKVVHEDNEGAESFALQLLFTEQSKLDDFDRNIAPKINGKLAQAFSGKFASFRTVLKVIS